MSDLHLFPLPAPQVAAAAPELSADRRRTLVNRALLDQGRHPATGLRLLDAGWGYRCRDCAHAVRIDWHNRSFWKCLRHRLGLSHSAASDIRAGWPACTALRIDTEDHRA
jgi:hypothetical protein